MVPHARNRCISPAPMGIVAVIAMLVLAACGRAGEPLPLPPMLRETPEGPPQVSLTPSPSSSLELEVAFPQLEDLPRMVHLTHPGDGSNRLFVVLQSGVVVVFPNDHQVTDASTFLDIRSRVNTAGNERGLLGLAFDPSYAQNGYLYVNYTTASHTVVSRFSVDSDNPDRADPASEQMVLQVPQPFANHNGGTIAFGPDGYLYVGLGDGGSGGDPQGNGQDLSNLLGAILRIDVSGPSESLSYSIPPDNPFSNPGHRHEIWAYGLRNPWRFAFDRATGDMWAADVGQNRWEEIDLIKPGSNYGWNRMEGNHCFPPSVENCDRSGLEQPIAEYLLTNGRCAIIGGAVYRGERLPSLEGAYLYADHCSGELWSLWYNDGEVTGHELLVDSNLQISAFGKDQAGEVYILAFDGHIYRLR